MRTAGTATRFSTLFAKYEAAQFISQAFGFGWVFRSAELFSKFEEGLLFLLVGFYSQLDELDQNTIVAEPPPTGDGVHPFCNRSR